MMEKRHKSVDKRTGGYQIPCPSLEKKVIFIYFQNIPLQKTLSIPEHELKSQRIVKKRILNQFGFEQSQIKKIQLNIMEVYPNQPGHIKVPIFNQQNFKIIIGFLLSCERDIRIQASHLVENGELVKKEFISQEAIQKGELHFDQNGSLIEENDGMKDNIPENQKYDNSVGHVRCEFCQKNNKDIQSLKRCGGLYGRFLGQKYVHLLCALWCHRVFLSQVDNLLMNVDQEIQRASKKKCRCCGEFGAGLVCVGSRETKKGKKIKCGRSYHFVCAYDSSCLMSWIVFQMLCPTCKEDEEQQEMIQKTIQEKLNRTDFENQIEIEYQEREIQDKEEEIENKKEKIKIQHRVQ